MYECKAYNSSYVPTPPRFKDTWVVPKPGDALAKQRTNADAFGDIFDPVTKTWSQGLPTPVTNITEKPPRPNHFTKVPAKRKHAANVTRQRLDEPWPALMASGSRGAGKKRTRDRTKGAGEIEYSGLLHRTTPGEGGPEHSRLPSILEGCALMSMNEEFAKSLSVKHGGWLGWVVGPSVRRSVGSSVRPFVFRWCSITVVLTTTKHHTCRLRHPQAGRIRPTAPTACGIECGSRLGMRWTAGSPKRSAILS